MRILVIIILLGIFQGPVFTQISNKKCKQKILNYDKDLEGKIKQNSSKTYYAEMSYLSYVDQMIKSGIVKPKTISSKVKMYRYGERSCFENDKMVLYRDDKDIFTVLKTDRMILRSPITSEQMQKQSTLNDFFKDSLFAASDITNCKKAGGAYSQDVIQMQMLLPEKYQRAVKAKEFTLYFDDEQQKMLALEIHFLPGHKIRKQVIKYIKQGFINTGLLKRPVRENFLDKKGRLLPKYGNFKYMDSAKG